MEGDQVGAAGLSVRELVNVEVLGRAHEAFRQFAGADLEEVAFLGHFKNRFGGFAAEDAHRTGRTAVIMDWAALAVAPAEDQGMVRGAGMHEVAPIAFRGKFHEGPDGGEVHAQAFKAVGQNIKRDALAILIQLREPLFNRQLHKSEPAVPGLRIYFCSWEIYHLPPAKTRAGIPHALKKTL